MRPTTICFLIRKNEILLAMKKRGFGVGKWNGVGGKLQGKETIKEAAVREMKEEIGVTADLKHLESAGSIKFYFKNKPEWDQHMHIFLVKKWDREPEESEEMKPKWYKYKEIPFKKMWVADKCWIPKVLAGKKIKAKFNFNSDGSAFNKFEIKEI